MYPDTHIYIYIYIYIVHLIYIYDTHIYIEIYVWHHTWSTSSPRRNMEQTVHKGHRAKKEQKESIARKMLDKNSKGGCRKRKIATTNKDGGRNKRIERLTNQNGAKRGVHQHGRGEKRKLVECASWVWVRREGLHFSLCRVWVSHEGTHTYVGMQR